MKDFEEFVDESCLKSNFAPLYHFTDITTLKDILKDDILKIGYYDNPYFGDNIKFISLTRNKDFELHRKYNVRLDLDQDFLKNDYSIVPYDFFIQSKSEIYPNGITYKK